MFGNIDNLFKFLNWSFLLGVNDILHEIPRFFAFNSSHFFCFFKFVFNTLFKLFIMTSWNKKKVFFSGGGGGQKIFFVWFDIMPYSNPLLWVCFALLPHGQSRRLTYRGTCGHSVCPWSHVTFWAGGLPGLCHAFFAVLK